MSHSQRDVLNKATCLSLSAMASASMCVAAGSTTGFTLLSTLASVAVPLGLFLDLAFLTAKAPKKARAARHGLPPKEKERLKRLYTIYPRPLDGAMWREIIRNNPPKGAGAPALQ